MNNVIRTYPYSSFYYKDHNTGILEIKSIKRDGYKLDWFKYINALHDFYYENEKLYLIVELFNEIDEMIDPVLNEWLSDFACIYDCKFAKPDICLNSTFNAIKQVGFFLRLFPQYQNHILDFSGNLMVKKSGLFVFCDPLKGE